MSEFGLVSVNRVWFACGDGRVPPPLTRGWVSFLWRQESHQRNASGGRVPPRTGFGAGCPVRFGRRGGVSTAPPCAGENRAPVLGAPLRAGNLAALQCSARPDGNEEKVSQPGGVASSLPLALAARRSGGNPPVSATALTGGQAVRAPFFSLLFLGAQEKELALQGEILSRHESEIAGNALRLCRSTTGQAP